jgi:hypothetical protein
MSLPVRPVTATRLPFWLIYGPEGVGKTTLAAKFPTPVFLQVEDGCPAGVTLQSFGLLETFGQVRDALAGLATEAHEFRTVVVDSLDLLEAMIWKQACKDNGWASIEQPGFGKGYVIVDSYWLDLLAAFDFLRRERGMMTVLLAHSAIERIDDPRAASFTSYQLRLHKRARGIVQDAMDAIGFLAPDLIIHSEDQGFSKKRTRADGGSTRYIHWEGRPSFVAKNRYALPARMMVPQDFNFEKTLAPYFSSALVGNRPIKEPAK